ncbi:hypothetical protein [uncultured Cetobacterium sp.]|uniref:hypothetical protein n=1 Tax=uncultured Cetobacterium sp. TaxID=527638 RepID=UPI0026257C3F|nr:hypothetical protein [uncultured Cetobacterium sp.]
MSKVFFNDGYEATKPKKITTGTVETKKTNDTNMFSSFGTIFTQSSSTIAGITESVITPGFRLLKFASTIMKVFKKLQNNFSTITNKAKNIEKIMSSMNGNGSYIPIRESIIKMAIKDIR